MSVVEANILFLVINYFYNSQKIINIKLFYFQYIIQWEYTNFLIRLFFSGNNMKFFWVTSMEMKGS